MNQRLGIMEKSDLEAMKKRIRGLVEHHAEFWAKRLGEVGGPGVGGTELGHFLF